MVCWLGLIFCSFGSQIGISWPLIFDQPNSIVSVAREAIVTGEVFKRSKFQKNFADGAAFWGRRSKKPRSAISSTGKCIWAACRCTDTLNNIAMAPRLGRSYICRNAIAETLKPVSFRTSRLGARSRDWRTSQRKSVSKRESAKIRQKGVLFPTEITKDSQSNSFPLLKVENKIQARSSSISSWSPHRPRNQEYCAFL